MDRLQKKCFVASSGFHGVLLLIVVFGAAFFTPEKKDPPIDHINVIPTKWVEDALSGGGGNPNIPRTDAKIKGDTLEPVPQQPVVKQPDPPKPKVEKPQPKPPEPEPLKVEPKKTSIPKEPT